MRRIANAYDQSRTFLRVVSMKLRILVPLLLFAAACLTLLLRDDSFSESALAQGKAQPSTVETVRPRSGDFPEPLKLPGSLEPFEVARLHAKITGFLKAIHVDLGDEVKKGQLLAELDIPEMEPQLDIAKSELAAALARVENARADEELAGLTATRVKELHKSEPGAVTGQDVDVVVAKLKIAGAKANIAKAEVRLAEARIRHLETMMTYTKIPAPFDGTVTRRFAHTGILIEGGDTSGKPIVEVVRTDRLRLAIELPEIVVPHVGKGHEVAIVIDALPGKSYTGTISRLSGVLMASTRNRRVEVDLDGRDGTLLPGMYATVQLDFRTFSNALSLPAKAIHRVQGEDSVFVVAEERLQRVAVAVLMDNGKQVVVSGDLKPDNQVVVTKPRLVKVGDEVRTQELNGASK